MLTYYRIANKPHIFQNFTGLTLAAFEQLLLAFAKAYEASLDERDAQRAIPRQRQRGGRRKSLLYTAADKLLFILFSQVSGSSEYNSDRSR